MTALTPSETEFAPTAGGTLAWQRWGEGERVVLGLHGTPGSRMSALPDAAVLAELDLTYCTFDRPGYGDSTRIADRTVADGAADVAAVADAAGAPSFALIGGSGGTAFALAAAAALGERVTSLTLVVPTAPRVGDVSMGDEAWFAGMGAQMASLHQLATRNDASLLQAALTAAMGPGSDGVVPGLVDDLLAIHAEWGVDFAAITAPVTIWFGIDDENAPPAQARWLASQLPGAELLPQEGDHSWPATKMREIFRGVR